MQPQTPAAPMPSATPPVVAPTPQAGMQLDPAYAHTGLATASLILGIVSLPASILNILTLPIPVTAIVLGIVSLKRKKSFALAGIILGVIGIILSGIVLVVGTNQLNKNKAAGTVTTKGVNGAQINSTCYSFAIPPGLTKKDVRKNADCLTTLINAGSSEDLAIFSSPVKTVITDANRDAILKQQIDEFTIQAGSAVQITEKKFTTVDGQRAYEAKGTETSGNYKYVSFLAVLAPKEYTSAQGLKLKGFVMASDSATSMDIVDKVAETWHWL